MVLSHTSDSACAAGTAGWGCPSPAALGSWLHLRAPGIGKMGSFCSVPHAGMSEPVCRDMGDAQHFPCVIVSCVGCPVLDSLSLAVLVVSVSPPTACRQSWEPIEYGGPTLVRLLSEGLINNPSEQCICSCVRIAQMMLCEDGVMCILWRC